MIRLLLVFLIFLPGQAVAQQVRVTSGEHAGFTRLVINFRSHTEWVIGSVEDGYEFRTSDFEGGFNLGKAFDLIQRRRVRDIVRTEVGGFQIITDCDCHINAFELAAGQVVIDVIDGPAPAELERFQEPLDSRVETPGLPIDLAPFASPMPHVDLPIVIDGQYRRDLLPALAAPESNTKPSIAEPDFNGRPPATSDRVTELVQAFSEQLARATAMGLVQPAIQEMEAYSQSAKENTERVEPEPTSMSTDLPLPEKTHVEIETSFERATSNRVKPENSAVFDVDGEKCLDGELFNISDWGGDFGVETGIGAFRSGILGEFDLEQTQGVEGLVKYYLFMTFGAEAKAVLSRFGDDLEGAVILEAMADIVDQRPVEHIGPLYSQLGCDSPAALWAVLAHNESRLDTELSETGIIRAFADLPPHLRSQLGPVLVRKLLDFGHNDAAKSIETITKRIGDVTPEMRLMSARMARAGGDTGEAEQLLENLISVSSTALEDALVERVDIALDEGQIVDENTINLLESLVFEHRGGELERVLEARLLAALIQAQQFDSAEKHLRVATSQRPDMIDEFANSLFLALVESGKVGDLARISTRNPEWLSELRSQTRAVVARALVEGHLPDAARRVLAASTSIPTKAERIVLAEIALMNGNPRSAIGYLAGIEIVEADLLRARAFQEAGDYDRAISIMVDMGLVDEAAAMAWENGLWSQAASSSLKPVETAASVMEAMQGRGDVVLNSDRVSLAESNGILKESAFSRDLISDLLAATEINLSAVNQ